MRFKRWLALFLAAAMLLSLVPTAYATICDVHTPTRQVTQEPTCVDYGYYINVCAVCGQPLDNGGVLDPLGHDFRNDWSEMYPATCTEPGMEIRFCHRCQQEEVRTTSALGHHWEEQTVFFKDPTCTEDGFREYLRRCTRCGEYDQSLPITGTEGYRVNIPALGHDWGDWKEEYPGNCSQQGMNVRTCRRCGLEQYVYSGYGDHDWGEWHVVTPAGPGVPGLEERVCKINSAHVEQREIPPLPKALYVLKGVERDFDGYYMDAGGCQPNYLDGRAYHFIWEDAEPVYFTDYHAGVSQFFKDSGETIPLMTEPVAGETYYFDIAVFNDIANTDHSMDFSQVDADLVDVTMKGFTVTYLGFEPEVRDDSWDACNLYFSATYLGKPELTLTYVKVVPEKEVYDPDDSLIIHYEVENTGDVPLRYVLFTEDYIFGSLDDGYSPEIVLQPGEKDTCFRAHDSVKEHIKPGTATAELLGMDEVIGYAYGFDADSIDDGSMASALCKSNTITNEFKVGRAAPGTYILKGVQKDYPGLTDVGGQKAPDAGSSPYAYTWADKAGEMTPAVSSLFEDAALTQPLTGDPVKGETYRFFLNLRNGFGSADHSIDLRQIDPALVDVTLAGFDVTYLGCDVHDQANGAPYDYVNLLFSATCTQASGPALTLTWLGDSDENFIPYATDEHLPTDGVWADYELENTGTVQLLTYYYHEWADGDSYSGVETLLDPAVILKEDAGWIPIVEHMTPGTETDDLFGTVTLTIWYDGLDPMTYEKLCESNKIVRVWKIVKDPGTTTTGDGLHPQLTLTASWAPDAGVGKCYLDAPIQFTLTTTNTGDCPVTLEFSNPKIISLVGPVGPVSLPGVVELQPNESVDWTVIDPADAYEVEHERYLEDWHCSGKYLDAAGEKHAVDSNWETVDIPLTSPGGTDPDPDKPALTVQWTYDEIWPYWGDGDESTYYATTTDGVYDAKAHADAYFDVINDGNVKLLVKTYCSYGNGYTSEADWPGGYSFGVLLPAESGWDSWCNGEALGDSLTPNSETSELQGTVDITIWAKGFDPETGEELCTSNTITRCWPVRKPGPTIWEIPEESELTVSIAEESYSTDPMGYQLFEYWDTSIYVYNTGAVDVPEYTLHVDVTADKSYPFIDWVSLDATDGATWYEKTITDCIAPADVHDQWTWSPDGEVAAGDVTRGKVKASVYVTWEDPDSLNPRKSNVASITLPVISATGLVLKKGYEKPANGTYFQENETINWTLTIKNTTEEPIYNVEVTDEGKVIATFPVLNPGQEEPIAVPGHVVTDYDVNVVGHVLNQAFATGEDLKGISHVYPSNIVKAPCTDVPPPPPPPPEKKDKDDPPEDPKIESKPGDSCQLILTAVGDAEARYTLHTCDEHLAAAKAADAAGSSAEGWKKAADIWREEIDKLYQDLADAANDDGKAAVAADQAAFWAYADAFAAMTAGQPDAPKALADMLRLRCAELCCMKHTAPDVLPDSLLGDYASLMNVLPADETSLTFGRMSGKDVEVTLKLDADLAAAMDSALSTVHGSKSDYAEKAFVTAQAQWQMTLDGATNAAYRAADRDARKLIAAWRKSLDQLIAARRELLSALYDGHGEIIEECLMNLYRDAAILQRIAQ